MLRLQDVLKVAEAACVRPGSHWCLFYGSQSSSCSLWFSPVFSPGGGGLHSWVWSITFDGIFDCAVQIRVTQAL